MKISINNYEAYLIDYMEGRLNDAEIQQLKVFCTLNHIDFEELTEDLPILKSPNDSYDEKEQLFKNKIVPFDGINENNYEERFIAYQELLLDEEEKREVEDFVEQNRFLIKDLRAYAKCKLEPDTNIVFEDKDSLKKTAIVMPLYAKIAAVAAVIALLFGLFWLPKNENNSINQQPVLVELTPETNDPISDTTLISPENPADNQQNNEFSEEGRDVACYVSKDTQPLAMGDVGTQTSLTEDVAHNVSIENETEEIPQIRIGPKLLASLSPRNATEIKVSKDFAIENELFPETVFYLPTDYSYLAQNQDNNYEQYDHHLSLIGRGIRWLSDGRYESFGGIFRDGLHIARREALELSEQVVAIAYIKADESFSEAKARLEERFERKEE